MRETNQSSSNLKRRTFVQSTLAGTGFMILKPQSIYGAPANSALQLGVIGCGGRGNYDTSEFLRNTNTRVTAIADFFQDRLESTKENFDKRMEARGLPKIEPSRVFQGMNAYQDLLETDVDMVLITSPPYFHPTHFMAAVESGKHIYMEKPVGVDVVGAKKVLEAGKKAKEKGKQSCMIGFQIRFSEAFEGVVKRVHEGAIGEIVCGQVYYHSGALSPRDDPKYSEVENRLRNWVFDQKLSGDIIVEQNVHVLDVGNWYLQNHPIQAVGKGGQKARFIGDCYDHFVVTYTYPGDLLIDFASTQFLKGWSDCRERMFGTQGTADTPYGGYPQINGKTEWKADTNSPLNGTVARKVRHFEESIRSGNYVNEVEQGVTTTLTGILGRMAAYEQRLVTWDEMMKSDLNYEVDLKL